MKITRLFLPCLLVLSLASCATYTTPGRPADLGTFSNPKIKKAYVPRPTMRFPANIAVVRVQEGGYRAHNEKGYGQGAYSVVTTRDIEREEDVKKLQNLPGLQGIATLNRLLLPQSLNSDEDLREAAAKLHADAILIYTISTQFRSNDVIPPLTILSLGLLNVERYEISSSASAVLMDTRTGYVYGALEEGNDRVGGNFIFSGTDAARKASERSAYEKLLAAFDPFWRGIHDRFR